ncbi:unnamed protein product [Phytophthora fragariaefolia]|uniref:Unnamed protein product n=1 Tax=Phytophthora fragariaefolia TaxID=1490495 RepID=A0A9W6Y4I3_9STRA|nr:unnamed protein product [Phytophthora fragariaefolia]
MLRAELGMGLTITLMSLSVSRHFPLAYSGPRSADLHVVALHGGDASGGLRLGGLPWRLWSVSSQREQELAELARLVAFSLTRPAVPSDRAQRAAVLSAASIHELGDALRHPFAGPDSSAVIADMRSELQVAQQINSALTRPLDTQSAELADLRSQLNIMTLERDRLLDLSKQSTAFTASLRKSVAELEAQAAVVRSQADDQVAAAFRHADGFKRQVQDRDQEIAALRSVIAHHRAVVLRQKRVIARQGSIPMHGPHTAAAAAGGLDAPGLSPSDLQLNVRLCRILAERFPEAMEITSGETRVLELRIGSRQDGALTVPPGSSSPRQASGSTAQPSSIGLAASGVESAGGASQPRRTLAQLRRSRPNTLSPAEKLHRLSHPVSTTAAGSRRKPHQPPDQPYSISLPAGEGHEEVMELLAGDDLGAVSDEELLRLSAASSRRRRHRRRASSSVTSSSVAKVARLASAAGDEASFDFDLGDPMEDVELDASVEMGVSVTSSTGAVSTMGTSSVVTPTSNPVTATSSTTVTTKVSAAPTVYSAVVSCSAPQDSSVSMATSSSAATASSTAVLVSTRYCSAESASADSSVPASLPMASSAVGLSVSCSTASTIGLASSTGLNVSTSILLLAPFPTSGVVTSAPSSAGPVVASAPTLTSTPLSSTSLVASSTASSTVMSIPASSSAVITAPTTSSAALSVSDRVALGLGGSAESSSDSTSRGAGSSTKPMELLSGSSDAESDSIAASTAENESSRGQTGHHGYQATTAPHPKARALSSATPALDEDDSFNDSDDISLRDLVSRMQTGRVATHGTAQSYLALGRTPPSSPRSPDSTGVLSAQRSSSSPKKMKVKEERRKHKHCHKRKHKSKHRHKHKHRPSDMENSAGSAGDAEPPRRSKRLASSDSAGCPRSSNKSRRDVPPNSSRPSNHSAGASPVIPSSLHSTTASIGVPPPPRGSLDSSFAGGSQAVVQYLADSCRSGCFARLADHSAECSAT